MLGLRRLTQLCERNIVPLLDEHNVSPQWEDKRKWWEVHNKSKSERESKRVEPKEQIMYTRAHTHILLLGRFYLLCRTIPQCQAARYRYVWLGCVCVCVFLYVSCVFYRTSHYSPECYVCSLRIPNGTSVPQTEVLTRIPVFECGSQVHIPVTYTHIHT